MIKSCIKTVRLCHFRKESTVASVRDKSDHRKKLPPTSGFEKVQAKESYNNVVSLAVVGGRITWGVVNRQGDQLCLQSLTTRLIELKTRIACVPVLKMVRGVVAEIPQSDLYILEEPLIISPKPPMFNFFLQTTQVRSFILGLLAARKDGCQPVISGNGAGIGSTFKLIVGTEKVSGQGLVEKMLDSATESNLIISQDARSSYEFSNPELREHLAVAFLVNLAYWKDSSQLRVT